MDKFKLADVEDLCSSLDAIQKITWVDAANACFSSLRGQGIDESICEEKAILKASSLFSEQVAVPAMALMFSDKEIKLKFLKNEEEEAIIQLDMVGYSGGVIKEHWWWDNLVIDLDGVFFIADKFPILENHDTNKKIAFTGKPVVDDRGISADPKTTVFMENELANEFISNSTKGFPYQSSMYVQPTSIERIEKDVEVEVNGFTLKGPGTVFRKCEFKEMSVCVFGWDSNTSATAFNKEINIPVSRSISKKFSEQVSDDGQSSHEDNNNFMEEKTMDKAKLKKDHPELYAEIYGEGEAAGKDSAEAAFGQEKEGMEVKFEEMNGRILKFEKVETIRSEKELKLEVDIIFTNKLTKSDVPEHLYGKVKHHVSYTKFMEDGKLDIEQFSKAIDTEIKSWIDSGISNTVLGSSFSSDPVNEDKKIKLAQETDDCVDGMLSIVQ